MIHIALTTEDRMKVFKLRYDVYVNEMKRDFLKKGNVAGHIQDERDLDSHLLIVKEKENIVGTLRVFLSNWTTYHREKFGIQTSDENFLYAVVDNFVLHPEYRRKGTAARLMLKAFHLGVKAKVDLCLIESADDMLDLYLKLGFTAFRQVDKKGHRRHQLYINPNDRIYLKEKSSVLYKIIKEREHALLRTCPMLLA